MWDLGEAVRSYLSVTVCARIIAIRLCREGGLGCVEGREGIDGHRVQIRFENIR